MKTILTMIPSIVLFKKTVPLKNDTACSKLLMSNQSKNVILIRLLPFEYFYSTQFCNIVFLEYSSSSTLDKELKLVMFEFAEKADIACRICAV